MKLDQNTASTIVRNVLGAANQRAQIGIEADLHDVPVKEIKALLKDAGVDLRSLKGEGKHVVRHGVEAKSPKKHYEKPEILPGPPEEQEESEEIEEQAKKAYEEFGVPAYLTESAQKAADDKKNAAEKQRVESVSLTEKADGSIGMAIKENPGTLEPLPASTDLKDVASGGLYRVENIAAGELLGQPCTDPSTMLLYGEAPQKIASLEEIFDGLRVKVEKLRDQRRELAEQLRKTDDLLTYISMRCDLCAEIAGEAEKKAPRDCLTYIGET